MPFTTESGPGRFGHHCWWSTWERPCTSLIEVRLLPPLVDWNDPVFSGRAMSMSILDFSNEFMQHDFQCGSWSIAGLRMRIAHVFRSSCLLNAPCYGACSYSWFCCTGACVSYSPTLIYIWHTRLIYQCNKTCLNHSSSTMQTNLSFKNTRFAA